MLLQVLHVQKMVALAYSEGGVLVPLTKKVISGTFNHARLEGQ